nr:Adrenodoxin mitochondrial [Hymenolepis microstoma]
MVDAQSVKSSKKRKKSPDISEEFTTDNDLKQRSSKGVEFFDETAAVSAEITPKQIKPKLKPKFIVTPPSQTFGGIANEAESKSAKRKSVHCAEKLELGASQTVGSKPILKSPRWRCALEATVTTTGDKQAVSSEKKKLSKNTIKRIKWVKRHRQKTVSKRKRKANLKLARSRPQREVQDRVSKAIEYLSAWYESPETWKYQKIAQITLIKHAFNSQLINDDTYELLLHYLAGVQGGSCDRIRSMCQQVIDNEGAQPECPALPLAIPESNGIFFLF